MTKDQIAALIADVEGLEQTQNRGFGLVAKALRGLFDAHFGDAPQPASAKPAESDSKSAPKAEPPKST